MLQVILRTHDGSSVHNYAPRITRSLKKEIVHRCMRSLDTAVRLTDAKVSVRVLDDHSTDETISLAKSFGWDVHSLEGRGNNHSMLATFTCAQNCEDELVYVVEDDFLHYPDAIRQMLRFYRLAKRRGIKIPAIHPYDDMDNYEPAANIRPSRIVLGEDRHWRTNEYSTCTVLTSPKVFDRYWEMWHTMATKYEKDDGITHEGTTINRIWTGGEVILFTPMPSLAIHMNHNEPPMCDWRTLWENNGG